MKKIIRLALLLTIPLSCFASPICYFMPPQGWECVQTKNCSNLIQAAFVGKGKTDFHPSLNLAMEEIDVPLNEYLKSVKEIHESELNATWRDLGPFTFGMIQGRLAQITTSSPMGKVKMLQGIFVQDNYAYILTGATLAEEFASFQSTLIAALRSLTVVPDLLSAIPDVSKKADLQKTFQSFDHLSDPKDREKEWAKLQKIVLEEHAAMGACWHFLVLKEGFMRIFPTGQKP